MSIQKGVTTVQTPPHKTSWLCRFGWVGWFTSSQSTPTTSTVAKERQGPRHAIRNTRCGRRNGGAKQRKRQRFVKTSGPGIACASGAIPYWLYVGIAYSQYGVYPARPRATETARAAAAATATAAARCTVPVDRQAKGGEARHNAVLEYSSTNDYGHTGVSGRVSERWNP